MSVECFEFATDGTLRPVAPEEVAAAASSTTRSFWVHVRGSAEAAPEPLRAFAGFEAAYGEVAVRGHAPRAVALEDGVFFELPTWVSGRPPEVRAAAIARLPRLILTRSDEPAEDWLATVSGGRKLTHGGIDPAGGFLVHVMGQLPLRLRETGADLRRAIDELSRRMDDEPDDIELEQILALRQRVLDLEAIAEERLPVLEDLETLQHQGSDSPDYRLALDLAVNNTEASNRRADRLHRRVGELMLRYDAHGQARTNRRLGRLTVISAIFLPLTLLAGVYGMNFDHMPELHWRFGYPALLGLMGGVGVAMFVWFRSRGWLE